jgi:tryptophan synthase alpha chain
LPICVGFGISNAAQASEVAQIADGIVVGSALVAAAGRSTDEAIALTTSLRNALDT